MPLQQAGILRAGLITHKKEPKMSRLKKALTNALPACLALAVLFAALPPAVVSAASPAEPTPPPAGEIHSASDLAAREGFRKRALERIYSRQQDKLARQDARLERAAETNTRVESLIERIRERGLDPAPIVSALAEFNSGIADARRNNLKARAILTIHAGFDDNGQVIQFAEARETVGSAGTYLHSTADSLNTAVRGLVQALRNFWQENRPESQPGEPIQP